MKVNNYVSQCTPELNAKIMRGIEKLVCDYRENLPNGWRCCIEFQRDEEHKPYYQLDIESNKGGGSFAPVKMQMLKICPSINATGTASIDDIRDALQNINPKGVDNEITKSLLEELDEMECLPDFLDVIWEKLKDCGITHWYGGIRIPYDILLTDYTDDSCNGDKSKQDVRQTTGEIRITFSGAREWQDTFFCFCLFGHIQHTLNTLWEKDQIWYSLGELECYPDLRFWIFTLGVQEAPER